jgi:hypothetical protein
MRKLKFLALILFVLTCGYGIAQLGQYSDEELSDALEAMEIVFGEAKVIETGSDLVVRERSKGGTAPNGRVVEGGLVMNFTRIVKFRDGRTTCYMLTGESSGISCVRTVLP